MRIQLRLLEEDDEHSAQGAEVWSNLPESTRRDLCERFAELLVAVVRSASRKEGRSDLDEDHAEAPGA